MVGNKNVYGHDHIYLGSGDIPKIPIRPDHAFRLEDIYSCHIGVVGRHWGLDANTLEYLEIIQSVYVYPNLEFS
jgi:hypothetical protein